MSLISIISLAYFFFTRKDSIYSDIVFFCSVIDKKKPPKDLVDDGNIENEKILEKIRFV